MTVDSPTPARRALPIGATAMAALQLLSVRRDDLLRIAIWPLGLTFLLSALFHTWPSPATWMLAGFANLVPLTLFAVAWQRLILRGSDPGEPSFAMRWTPRETRFVGRLLLQQVACGLGVALPLSFVMPIEGTAIEMLYVTAVMLAALFLALRFSLVLPAIAVDHAYSVAQSWEDTANCGGALLGIMLLAVLPILAGFLLFMLLTEATGLAAVAPYSMLLVGDVIGYGLVAGGFAVLALAFAARSDWPGPSRLPQPAA